MIEPLIGISTEFSQELPTSPKMMHAYCVSIK